MKRFLFPILIIFLVVLLGVVVSCSHMDICNDDCVENSENKIQKLESRIESLEKENKELVKVEKEELKEELVKVEEVEVEEEINNNPPALIPSYLNYFLVSEIGVMDPANMNNFLVPVVTDVNLQNTTNEEKVLRVLEKLFEVDSFEYGQSGYTNYLYESVLTVESVSNQSGVTIVDLEGQLTSIGSIADPFIKGQITRTIEEYVGNYIIKLNGSEAEWECSLDKSGLCGNEEIIETREVSLYYYNLEEDKKVYDWISFNPEFVLPIKRVIPISKTPIRDTFDLLFGADLTEAEKEDGFKQGTFAAYNFEIQSLILNDGVLKIDFVNNPYLGSLSSTESTVFVSSLKKTAAQFPEILKIDFINVLGIEINVR